MKELRKLKSWTQKHTAKQFGVSLRTIEAWEQGRLPISKPARIIYNYIMATGPSKPTEKQVETILQHFPEHAKTLKMRNDIAIILDKIKIGADGKIIVDNSVNSA